MKQAWLSSTNTVTHIAGRVAFAFATRLIQKSLRQHLHVSSRQSAQCQFH